MERNFSRSSNGSDRSRPSSKTRELNSIQPNSRFKNICSICFSLKMSDLRFSFRVVYDVISACFSMMSAFNAECCARRSNGASCARVTHQECHNEWTTLVHLRRSREQASPNVLLEGDWLKSFDDRFSDPVCRLSYAEQ